MPDGMPHQSAITYKVTSPAVIAIVIANIGSLLGLAYYAGNLYSDVSRIKSEQIEIRGMISRVAVIDNELLNIRSMMQEVKVLVDRLNEREDRDRDRRNRRALDNEL